MGATLGRPRETKPSYREAQVLLVLSPTGTTQVDIGLRLGQKMSAGDVSIYVNRLHMKGLVKIIGTVKQPKNGRYSRIVAPTDRGKEVILALQKKGVK